MTNDKGSSWSQKMTARQKTVIDDVPLSIQSARQDTNTCACEVVHNKHDENTLHADNASLAPQEKAPRLWKDTEVDCADVLN